MGRFPAVKTQTLSPAGKTRMAPAHSPDLAGPFSVGNVSFNKRNPSDLMLVTTSPHGGTTGNRDGEEERSMASHETLDSYSQTVRALDSRTPPPRPVGPPHLLSSEPAALTFLGQSESAGSIGLRSLGVGRDRGRLPKCRREAILLNRVLDMICDKLRLHVSVRHEVPMEVRRTQAQRRVEADPSRGGVIAMLDSQEVKGAGRAGSGGGNAGDGEVNPASHRSATDRAERLWNDEVLSDLICQGYAKSRWLHDGLDIIVGALHTARQEGQGLQEALNGAQLKQRELVAAFEACRLEVTRGEQDRLELENELYVLQEEREARQRAAEIEEARAVLREFRDDDSDGDGDDTRSARTSSNVAKAHPTVSREGTAPAASQQPDEAEEEVSDESVSLGKYRIQIDTLLEARDVLQGDVLKLQSTIQKGKLELRACNAELSRSENNCKRLQAELEHQRTEANRQSAAAASHVLRLKTELEEYKMRCAEGEQQYRQLHNLHFGCEDENGDMEQADGEEDGGSGAV